MIEYDFNDRIYIDTLLVHTLWYGFSNDFDLPKWFFAKTFCHIKGSPLKTFLSLILNENICFKTQANFERINFSEINFDKIY